MQQRIALSSGEAELYSSVRGLAEMASTVHLHRELYDEKWGQLYAATDATANRAILMRRGAGGVKHVETKYLWAQEMVRRLEVKVVRAPREQMHAHVLCSLARPADYDYHLGELISFGYNPLIHGAVQLLV